MKVAIIGAGNMGTAVARGLIDSGKLRPVDVAVSNRSQQKLDALRDLYPGVEISTCNADVLKDARIVVLAVKPWAVNDVVDDIRGCFDLGRQQLVSLASGVSLADLEGMIGRAAKVYRCIPNTAAAVRQSMTFVCRNANVSESELAQVVGLFEAMGHVDVIPEDKLGAATSVCSCGIAFVMRYMRAQVEGAVELGIAPSKALEYVMQTMEGAVAVVRNSQGHVESEIDRVTTPGGITIKGLNTMEKYGFTTAVIEGLLASAQVKR